MLGNKVIFPAKPLPTPFGKVYLPDIRTLKMGLPQVDSRRKEAVRHAVGMDFTGVLGLIPYVGALVGGQIADLHFAEMRRLLTPSEMDKFIEADKRIPSNGVALLYSFVKS